MVSLCIPLPETGDQKQWDYILSNFKPDTLYIIGDEANAPTTNVFKQAEAIYISSAEELPTDAPLVVFQPKLGRYVQGEIDLKDFQHPEDAIYLLGEDNVPLSTDELGNRTPDSTVYIETDTTDEMFSYSCYGVIAWDRRMKRG